MLRRICSHRTRILAASLCSRRNAPSSSLPRRRQPYPPPPGSLGIATFQSLHAFTSPFSLSIFLFYFYAQEPHNTLDQPLSQDSCLQKHRVNPGKMPIRWNPHYSSPSFLYHSNFIILLLSSIKKESCFGTGWFPKIMTYFWSYTLIIVFKYFSFILFRCICCWQCLLIQLTRVPQLLFNTTKYKIKKSFLLLFIHRMPVFYYYILCVIRDWKYVLLFVFRAKRT